MMDGGKFLNDLFSSRLGMVEDWEQREYLRKVLFGVFKECVEYSGGKYAWLESRINAEMRDSHEGYYIYTAAARVGEIDKLNARTDESGRFWSKAEDLHINRENYEFYALKKLYKQTDSGSYEPEPLNLFLNCGYETVKKYIGSVVDIKIFTAQGGEYIKPVKIVLSEYYRDIIEDLYRLFSFNGVPWVTVNCPFIFRFIDLVFQGGGSLPAGELITDFKFEDSLELDKYMVRDAVLLWNVHKLESAEMPEAFPSENMGLYEHRINIKDFESAYLFHSGSLKGIYGVKYRTAEKKAAVISEQAETGGVSVFRIAGENYRRDGEPALIAPGAASNKRKMRHTDRQAEYRRVIFTRAEIERICGLYADISDALRLNKVSAGDYMRGKNDRDTHVDLNPFIDFSSLDKYKRRLEFEFTAVDKSDFYIYEKMCFLVSELQLYFNEYECFGKITG